MLKSCIDDILCGKRTIIGIKNFVKCDKPESRLWINDYPGLVFKDAAKLSNEEMQTGNEVLETSIQQGIKLAFDDFMDFLRSKYDFNAIAETRQLENFSDKITTRANIERGLSLRRWRSEMALMHIEEVYIKTPQNTVIDLLVYDGTTLVKFENITLEADKKNVIRIDLICNSETVKILYNQKDNDVYKCDFSRRNGWTPCGSCGSRGGFVITGWDGNREADNCFGMGVLAYIRCYEEKVFCALIPRLYTAFYYRSVMEFMQYRLRSNRINNLTLFGEEKAKEMYDEAAAAYKLKYQTVVDNSAAFLRSLKGDCLTCNSMHYVQSTP